MRILIRELAFLLSAVVCWSALTIHHKTFLVTGNMFILLIWTIFFLLNFRWHLAYDDALDDDDDEEKAYFHAHQVSPNAAPIVLMIMKKIQKHLNERRKKEEEEE